MITKSECYKTYNGKLFESKEDAIKEAKIGIIRSSVSKFISKNDLDYYDSEIETILNDYFDEIKDLVIYVQSEVDKLTKEII